MPTFNQSNKNNKLLHSHFVVVVIDFSSANLRKGKGINIKEKKIIMLEFVMTYTESSVIIMTKIFRFKGQARFTSQNIFSFSLIIIEMDKQRKMINLYNRHKEI